jgi:hypothetical protein
MQFCFACNLSFDNLQYSYYNTAFADEASGLLYQISAKRLKILPI